MERLGLARESDAELDRHWNAQDRALIVLWRGRFLVSADETALCHLPRGSIFEPSSRENAIFLGISNDQPVWAVTIPDWDGFDPEKLSTHFFDQDTHRHPEFGDGVFAELRKVMVLLSRRDAELAATGRSLFEYHRNHGFCAKCGGTTIAAKGGWQRTCQSCERPHFPRTDPVVIMLITHQDKLLLGRSPQWPEDMYSLLAGFVEPGETVENAVRRESMEEAGITIGAVRYIGSQPWAFPASLMLGCQGKALTTDINLDTNELADAKWVSKEELISDLADGDTSLKAARKGAIAQHLIRGWVAGHLDGEIEWN